MILTNSLLCLVEAKDFFIPRVLAKSIDVTVLLEFNPAVFLVLHT